MRERCENGARAMRGLAIQMRDLVFVAKSRIFCRASPVSARSMLTSSTRSVGLILQRRAARRRSGGPPPRTQPRAVGQLRRSVPRTDGRSGDVALRTNGDEGGALPTAAARESSPQTDGEEGGAPRQRDGRGDRRQARRESGVCRHGQLAGRGSVGPSPWTRRRPRNKTYRDTAKTPGRRRRARVSVCQRAPTYGLRVFAAACFPQWRRMLRGSRARARAALPPPRVPVVADRGASWTPMAPVVFSYLFDPKVCVPGRGARS